MKRILFLALVLLLAGCSSEMKVEGPFFEPSYTDYETPDGLVENFILAWEARDAEEYADRVLYDGGELLAGRETCAAFKFYFLDSSFWGYKDECQHSEALFSGQPGKWSVPGVYAVWLELHAATEWVTAGDEVQGDTAPPGCMERSYHTYLHIALKGNVPGTGGIDGFRVYDRIQFYVVPVIADGVIEYRLWKWLDQSGNETAYSNWSVVKALYPE